MTEGGDLSVGTDGSDVVSGHRVPAHRRMTGYCAECFRHSHLIRVLGKKFLRDFYNRTMLAWWWLVIRGTLPVIGIIVILENIQAFSIPEIPYALYVASGMLVWSAVDIALTKSVRCLVQTAGVARAMYFPRMLIPLAANVLPLVYHVIFLGFFVIVVFGYYVADGVMYLQFHWRMFVAPVVVVLIMLFVTGLMGTLSVLFMIAKDVRFGMPLVKQAWFLATPIIYPISVLPENWQTVLTIFNPAVPLMDAMRWSLFGLGQFNVMEFAIAVFWVFAVLLFGVWFMMRSESALDEVL